MTTLATVGDTYGSTSDGQDTQSGSDPPVMSPILVNTDGSGGSAAQTFSDTIHGEDDESDDYTSTNIESVTVATNDGQGNTTTTTDTTQPRAAKRRATRAPRRPLPPTTARARTPAALTLPVTDTPTHVAGR